MPKQFIYPLAALLALGATTNNLLAQSRGWSPRKPTPYTQMAAAAAENRRAQIATPIPQPLSEPAYDPTTDGYAEPMPDAAPQRMPRAAARQMPRQQNMRTPAAPRGRQPQAKAMNKPWQPVNHQAAVEEMPAQPMAEGEMMEGSQYSDLMDGFEPGGAGCHDDCNDACCQPRSRIWARAEYLLWWTKGMDTPALATTSPDGTDQAEAGVLGFPGTSILFGDGGLNNSTQSGGRIFLGGWLDECHTEGIEFNYLSLGKQTDRFSGSSDEFAILARPFFDVETGEQSASLISFPDFVSGNLNIVATTSFQSAEALFRYVARQSWRCRTDLFVGYRYGDLRDHLRINEFRNDEIDPATLDGFDEFNTRNTFNGVDFGITQQWSMRCNWSLEASARVAIGTTVNRVGINGQTIITPVGADSETFAGNLLALPSNIGSYSQSKFGSIGEFGLTARRELKCGLTALVGYRFLYWANVARAGKQIDTRINPTQINGEPLEGEALPAFAFKTETFWAQGLHFGLEYAF
jgi:hypothetical protein